MKDNPITISGRQAKQSSSCGVLAKSAVLALFCLHLSPFTSLAQDSEHSYDKPSVSGSIQSDMMLAPEVDNAIGAYEDSYDNKYFLMNTYVDLLMQSKRVDAGLRAEVTQWPMPGFDDPARQLNFKGYGIPNIWAKVKFSRADVTLGSFYEQFGSGFILRTYEERTLGIDNSLLGARVNYTPYKGIRLTALSGTQRTYWKWNDNLISGANAEFSLDEWISAMANSNTHLTLGASWVNKMEKTSNKDDDFFYLDKGPVRYMLNVPRYVNAFDVRAQLQKGGFGLLAEYARKSADPNKLNNGIYGNGDALMLSANYAKNGLSILAQAKRSENMAFRSERGRNQLSPAAYINHLPAFTLDHTYSLAALYPYATQADGEWAFQGGLGYNFKRKTALGGKYGTKLKANYSLVKGLENNNVKGDKATDGIGNSFFGMGDTYYQDINLQMEKRLSKSFDIHLMYMRQDYNRSVIEGHGGNIVSNIYVAEGKYRFSKRYTLRAEAQYLSTPHESGDWGFGLLELSVAPYLMFTLSDQIGRCEDNTSETGYGAVTHYFNGSVTANYKSHRLQVGYGRTRSGYNCTGGVCRYIPASRGVRISYNYNF